jgi:hypothetical protein
MDFGYIEFLPDRAGFASSTADLGGAVLLRSVFALIVFCKDPSHLSRTGPGFGLSSVERLRLVALRPYLAPVFVTVGWRGSAKSMV